MSSQDQQLEELTQQEYKYGFVTDIESDTLPAGLDESVVRTISERKQDEVAIQREAAKLSAMIAGMKEGVLFVNAENRIVEVTDFVLKLYDQEKKDFLHKHVAEIYLGRPRSLTDTLRGVAAASPKRVHRMCRRLLDGQRVGLAAVGPVRKLRVDADALVL